MSSNKIKLVYLRGPFGDETSLYKVEWTGDITVDEFIFTVLKQFPKEWGSFESPILTKFAEYKYGEYKITNIELYEKIRYKKIISAEANGGWSLMSYYLVVE